MYIKINKSDLFIFDLDGTIVDSARTVLNVLNDIRATNGLALIQMDDLRPYLNKGGSLIVKKFMPSFNIHDINLNMFRNSYATHNLEGETLYDDVITFLIALKKKVKNWLYVPINQKN